MRRIEYEGAKSITRSEILDKLRDQKASLGLESPYDPVLLAGVRKILRPVLNKQWDYQ